MMRKGTHTTSTSIPRYRNDIQQKLAIYKLEWTHGRGERHNILDIIWSVDRSRVIRALLGDFQEAGDLEREALAIDDMPVEHVQL